jgi:hypothetical protein
VTEPAPHAAFAGTDGKVIVAHTNEDGVVTYVSSMSPHVVDTHLKHAGGQILMPSEHGKLHKGKKLKLRAGVLSEADQTDADLELKRRAGCATIDRQAERARGRFVTLGAGQLMEYEATLRDAQAVLNAGAGDHPWVAAEQAALESAGETLTMTQVAQRIVTRAQACQVALVKIKQVRRTAKLAVGQASSDEQIQAIVSALSWPTA